MTTSIVNNQTVQVNSSVVADYDNQASLRDVVILAPSLEGQVQFEVDSVTGGALLASFFSDVPLVLNIKHNNPIGKAAHAPQYTERAFSSGYKAQVYLWDDEHVTVNRLSESAVA